MGLDMYLKAELYVGGWEHNPEEERAKYNQIMSAVGFDQFRCDGSPSIDVSITVLYWRKANAIHKWFVDNVQGGVDECQQSHVERQQLMQLRDTCRETIANKDPSLLPTQEGFFFGSTEVDDWYWHDVINTELELTKLLDDVRFEKSYFYYRASW